MKSMNMRRWLHNFVYQPGFLKKYPYYASIISRLYPIDDPFVSVMGVSLHGPRFYLHVNIDFFTKNPKYLKGVLLHEVHHIALGHITESKCDGFIVRGHCQDLRNVQQGTAGAE